MQFSDLVVDSPFNVCWHPYSEGTVLRGGRCGARSKNGGSHSQSQ